MSTCLVGGMGKCCCLDIFSVDNRKRTHPEQSQHEQQAVVAGGMVSSSTPSSASTTTIPSTFSSSSVKSGPVNTSKPRGIATSSPLLINLLQTVEGGAASGGGSSEQHATGVSSAATSTDLLPPVPTSTAKRGRKKKEDAATVATTGSAASSLGPAPAKPSRAKSKDGAPKKKKIKLDPLESGQNGMPPPIFTAERFPLQLTLVSPQGMLLPSISSFV